MNTIGIGKWFGVAACLLAASSGCASAVGSANDEVDSVASDLRCHAGELATLQDICEDASQAIKAAALGSATAPQIQVGTTYGVHLIVNPAGSGKGGELSFVPTRTGVHTLYLGTPLMPFQIVAQGSAQPLTPSCVSAIFVQDCQPLRRAFAFTFQKGVTYRMTIGPISPEQWLRLRIEAPPPAGQIVFSATPTGGTHSDLFAMDEDGSNLTQLTNTPSDDEQFPRWSPDGSQIAYMRGGSLVVSNRYGQNASVVTSTVGRGSVGITAPAWSPDGSKLVYSYPRPPFNIDLGEDGIIDESYKTTLHVIHTDGSGDTAIPEAPHSLPPGIGTLTEPAWSSTGLIAFRQADDCPDCAGGARFAKVHEDGSNYSDVALSTIDRPDHDVDWSPDASHWVYTTLNPRDGRIAVSLPDGTSATTLTSVSSKVPRWSPDGAHIAFIGSDGIYVMNANGGAQHRVYTGTGIRGIDW